MYNKTAYVGLSSPDVVESTPKNNGGGYLKQRHFFVSAGKVFRLKDNWQIKPSLLGKYTKGVDVQLDLSATLIYLKTVGIGVSHRTGAGNSYFVQLFLKPKWTLAYAFDNMMNGLSGIEGGSHEVTLIYNLNMAQKIIYSPRYF